MKTFVLALFAVLALSRSAPADSSTPAVKLLSAGKGPKQALRFTAEKGLRRALVMRMTMGMTMTMGSAKPVTNNVPPIEMTMDMVVTDVAANGDISFEFELAAARVIADASTPPAVVTVMEDALKGMTGLKGRAMVTNRGFTKNADLTLPANASPQLKQLVDGVKQSMSQLSAPVPEEPVGVGASWETTTTLTQNNFTLTQVAVSKVTAIQKTNVPLKVTLTQSAKPQKVTANGITFDLDSYSAKGGGSTTLDLAGFVPVAATIKLKSKMAMKASGQKIGMSLDMAVDIEGR